MRLNLMPKARLGKWAVELGIVLIVLLVLELIFAIAIRGDPTVIDRSPLLTIFANILSVAFTFVGPLSLFLGIIATIKYKEWLVIKSLAALYILAILLFLFGEFLFPH